MRTSKPCLNFAERLAFKIFKSESVTQQLGMEGMARVYRAIPQRFHYSYGYVASHVRSCFWDRDYRRRISRQVHVLLLLGEISGTVRNGGTRGDRGAPRREYRTDNALTLIFTIHHSNSDKLIEMIRYRTIGVLSEVEPAKLDKSEAELFETAIGALHVNVVSTNPVEAERARDQKRRDEVELEGGGEPLLDEPAEKAVEGINDLYRIFKNNEILGHILRNKYGLWRGQKSNS